MRLALAVRRSGPTSDHAAPSRAIAGLQYLGLTLMSPVTGYMLQRFNTQRIMAVSMAINTVSCFVFGELASLLRRGLGLARRARGGRDPRLRTAITSPTSALLAALARSKGIILLARLFIGLSQANIIIYCPVWVDEFAPEATRTVRDWSSPVRRTPQVTPLRPPSPASRARDGCQWFSSPRRSV